MKGLYFLSETLVECVHTFKGHLSPEFVGLVLIPFVSGNITGMYPSLNGRMVSHANTQNAYFSSFTRLQDSRQKYTTRSGKRALYVSAVLSQI